MAKLCQVAPRTVGKWIDSGRLKGYRIPGSQDRRVPRANLIAFMKEHGMPLGELEIEMLFRVLLIGLETPLEDQLKALLVPCTEYLVANVQNSFEAGCLSQSFKPEMTIVDFRIGRSDAIGVVGRLTSGDPGYSAKTFVFGLLGEDDTETDKAYQVGGFNVVFRRPVDVSRLAEAVVQRAKWRKM